MEVRALAKYIRMSPKKIRFVADVLRGLSVQEAENQLRFIPRRASHYLLKTLNSAVANAENNSGCKKDNLYIKKIIINEGPALKRWMPKAFGSATPVKKRSSHIEIVVSEVHPTHVHGDHQHSEKIKKETTEGQAETAIAKSIKDQDGQEDTPAKRDIKKERSSKGPQKLGAKKISRAPKVFQRKTI